MNTLLNSEMFQNYINLKNPNLIIHGKEDKFFKYMLSMSISKRLENVSEWYPNHGNHFNIIENIKYRRKAMNKIKKMIYNSNINNEEDIGSVTANFINVPKNDDNDNINFENGSDSNENSTNNISNDKYDNNNNNIQNYDQSFCIKQNNNIENYDQSFCIKQNNNNEQNYDQSFCVNQNNNE